MAVNGPSVVERRRVELPTSALRTCGHPVASEASKQLTSTPPAACTAACTGKAETVHGDRLIGRIDPVMDRAHGQLRINAVYAEPDAPKDKKTARAIRDVVMNLAQFLGAREIVYSRRLPGAWTETLRRS